MPPAKETTACRKRRGKYLRLVLDSEQALWSGTALGHDRCPRRSPTLALRRHTPHPAPHPHKHWLKRAHARRTRMNSGDEPWVREGRMVRWYAFFAHGMSTRELIEGYVVLP